MTEHVDVFKESFKYYKGKGPLPDLSEVIDLDNAQEQRLQKLDLTANDFILPPGVLPIHTWKCYQLTTHAGLWIIKNPFNTRGQRYWMARCLRDYPCAPNIVNLNEHLFESNAILNWWQTLQACKDKDETRRLRLAMRWTTLGYHHDWNSKIYSEERRTAFPEDLSKLCEFFSKTLGFKNFKAEAAIVNYYPIGTTLAGHTDHSEKNLQAPLFSFSFGQTAIFLIGGTSRDIKPTAMFLRSGDILIMSGASRLCYHAIPRVMKANNEHWNIPIPKETLISDENTTNQRKKQRLQLQQIPNEWHIDTILYEQMADELYWTPFKQYLHEARININVRQVLPIGDLYLS